MRSFMFLRHLHTHATHFLQCVLHTKSTWHFLHNSWTFHSQVIATRTLDNKTTFLTNCIQNARVILFFTLTLWNLGISLWKVSCLRIFFHKNQFWIFRGVTWSKVAPRKLWNGLSFLIKTIKNTFFNEIGLHLK